MPTTARMSPASSCDPTRTSTWTSCSASRRPRTRRGARSAVASSTTTTCASRSPETASPRAARRLDDPRRPVRRPPREVAGPRRGGPSVTKRSSFASACHRPSPPVRGATRTGAGVRARRRSTRPQRQLASGVLTGRIPVQARHERGDGTSSTAALGRAGRRYAGAPHAPGRPPAAAAPGTGAHPGDRQAERGDRGARGGPRRSRSRPCSTSAPAGHSSSPVRPVPPPASSTTTCSSSCPTATSCCSPRGRRCRSSGSARAWRRWAGGSRSCGDCATSSGAPAIIVASVRSLLQRLGPGAIDVEPVRVTPGAIVDPDELISTARRQRLPPRRARRAPWRSRQTGRDRRRLPVDRRRADPHRSLG